MDENKWLCPHCVYGQLFRIVKDENHIPTHSEYMCIDRTKLIERKDVPPLQFIDTSTGEVTHTQKFPAMFDYEEGPGGWDGKECPNFIEKQPDSCNDY